MMTGLELEEYEAGSSDAGAVEAVSGGAGDDVELETTETRETLILL